MKEEFKKAPEKITKETLDKGLKETAEKVHHQDRSLSFIEILSKQLFESMKVYKMDRRSLFMSSFIAGLEIGFSYLLIVALVHCLSGTIAEENIFRLFAFFYPIGFVLVIIGKSILFTEQTSLLTLPVLNDYHSFGDLLRIWIVVIFGNLLGGITFGTFLHLIGTNLPIFEPKDAIAIGHHILSESNLALFFSAVLAGWLMGLLSWLLSSTSDTLSKIVLIFLVTGTIGFLGLIHSIVGNIEIYIAYLSSPEISLLHYLKFLGLALLGNAFGGAICVALMKYQAFIRSFKL